MQKEVMEKFLHPPGLPPATRVNNLERFHMNCGQTDDVCQWRGIFCDTESRQMKSLFLCGYSVSKPIIVSLDWLPPTLEHILFNRIFSCAGWSAAVLPRRLKYLMMENVKVYRSCRPYERCIDVRKLPMDMEELIIERSWYYGSVVIHNLPQSMRILRLNNVPSTMAFIDALSLPKSLRYLCLTHKGKNLTTLDMDGVESAYSLDDADTVAEMLRASRYCETMRQIAEGDTVGFYSELIGSINH